MDTKWSGDPRMHKHTHTHTHTLSHTHTNVRPILKSERSRNDEGQRNTHTRTNIHTHAHKRATGKTEIAMLDASGAVYPALLIGLARITFGVYLLLPIWTRAQRSHL